MEVTEALAKELRDDVGVVWGWTGVRVVSRERASRAGWRGRSDE